MAEQYVYLRDSQQFALVSEEKYRMGIVCCDLDGTLRFNVHRRHLLPSLNPESSWAQYAGAAGSDDLIEGTARLLELLDDDNLIHLVSCADHTSYAVTEEWLLRKGVVFDHLELTNHEELGSPSDVDRKLDYTRELIRQGYRVNLWIDNYAPVIRAMWTELGIPGLLINPDYPPLGPDGLPVEV